MPASGGPGGDIHPALLPPDTPGADGFEPPPSLESSLESSAPASDALAVPAGVSGMGTVIGLPGGTGGFQPLPLPKIPKECGGKRPGYVRIDGVGVVDCLTGIAVIPAWALMPRRGPRRPPESLPGPGAGPVAPVPPDVVAFPPPIGTTGPGLLPLPSLPPAVAEVCQAAIDAIREAFTDHIRECMTDPLATMDSVCSCIHGAIQTAIDSANATREACAGRVINSITGQIEEVISATGPICGSPFGPAAGVPEPSNGIRLPNGIVVYPGTPEYDQAQQDYPELFPSEFIPYEMGPGIGDYLPPSVNVMPGQPPIQVFPGGPNVIVNPAPDCPGQPPLEPLGPGGPSQYPEAYPPPAPPATAPALPPIVNVDIVDNVAIDFPEPPEIPFSLPFQLPDATGSPVCTPADSISFVEGMTEEECVEIGRADALFRVLDSTTGTAPGWISTIAGGPKSWITAFVASLTMTAIGLASVTLAKMAQLSKMVIPCQTYKFGCELQRFSLLTVLGKILGGIDHVTANFMRMRLNSQCQTIIPNGDELDRLRMRGDITQTEWEASHKMLGNCIPWRYLIAKMNSFRLGVNDAIASWKRGLIDEPATLEELRKNGITDKVDIDRLKRLARFQFNPRDIISAFRRDIIKDGESFYELMANSGLDREEANLQNQLFDQLPAISDLIRFMVRDAADPEVAAKYELDTDFERKWTGVLSRWAESQGIPEEAARFYWRSHWEIPSSGALYTMLQRLRPTRPKRGDQFDAVSVSLDDVREALRTNDMAPGFVEKMLAISYRPLGIRELRTAFANGTVPNVQDLAERVQDLGYSKTDADVIAKSLEKEVDRKRRKGMGIPASKVLDLYRTNAINEADARTLLNETDTPKENIPGLLESARIVRQAAVKRSVISAMQKRFYFGDVDAREATQGLLSIGVDAEQAQGLTTHWAYLLRTKKKEASASQLCQWFTAGLIDSDEWLRRLINMGYSTDDALRIISLCVKNDLEKKRKAADALAKKVTDKAVSDAAKREAARARAKAASLRAQEARQRAVDRAGSSRPSLPDGSGLPVPG